MRTVIDESVTHAKKYYQTYLREPSPAGDITISGKEISSAPKLDFITLLKALEGVGADGEILIVTHSGPEGFLMSLKAGGNASLKFSVMAKILNIMEAMNRREAIRTMTTGQSQAWKRWFDQFDPGVKLEDDYATNPDWKTYVESAYANWVRIQGRDVLKLPNPQQDLTELLDLVKAVRALGLKRVEFRACQIGKNTDAMKQIASFLNAKKVLGPVDVMTFYGVIDNPTVISDDKKFKASIKNMGGRTFAGINIGILTLPHGFRMIAKSKDDLKAFVKKYISAGFSGEVPPFVIGGVETTGVADKRQVYPLDKEYKDLIVQFDAAAAAASGVP